jgi:carbonic anhydrase
MRRLLASSLQTATFDGKQWTDPGTGQGSSEGEYVDWLTISEQHDSVVADVRRLRNHPLVPAELPIYGLIYDVRSGKLLEVPAAVAVGAPMQQAWARAA